VRDRLVTKLVEITVGTETKPGAVSSVPSGFNGAMADAADVEQRSEGRVRQGRNWTRLRTPDAVTLKSLMKRT
jgi:hypothetical protein